jgi:F-type H+-transporting ATPase subunit b
MNLTLIAAAAHGAEEGGDAGNALLAPSPGLMIWTLVTFLIALYFLNKKAFGPIQKALDARRAAISESVEAAERTKLEAEQLFAEYKEQLASARSEAEGILTRARGTGDEILAKMKADAEQQRQEQMAQTQQQVKAEVDKAMGDLRTAVADLTVEATEKVLRGAIDASGHQKLIEQSVEELDFSRLQVGAKS